MLADIRLRNGLVYDGSGAVPYRADMYIVGDSIYEINRNDGSSHSRDRLDAVSAVDCEGFAICPGFIDIHTHSDFALLSNGQMTSSIMQGVTTEVVGNCGVSMGLITDDPVFRHERVRTDAACIPVSWSRLSEWFDRVEDVGIACNIASLVGHGTVRKRVIGLANRRADAAELYRMQCMLAGALSDGAIGISTGLEYLPGAYADTAEQVSLVELLRGRSGFYATHVRNEGDSLVESIAEAIDVAERATVPLQLSHHKAEGAKNWGKVAATLAMMDSARARGLDVLTDLYPYEAFMTSLTTILLPAWANQGSSSDIARRLNDRATRAQIIHEINSHDVHWDTLRIGTARNQRSAQGMSISGLADQANKTPVDAALDLIVSEDCSVSALSYAMSPYDIEQLLRDRHTMIGSDGVAQTLNGLLSSDHTHPRTFGTFARIFNEYVRDRKLISFEEAVRRMTSLPATRMGLKDRGRLLAGMKADITIVDASRFADTATYVAPRQIPFGLRTVIVNGRISVNNGEQTDELAGRVLRY